jgi:predicted nuclease with TOPRIM domain
MATNAQLENKLQNLIGELQSVMQERKQRIESLRAEIAEIEQSNDRLESSVSNLLKSF